jgi:endonuclease/exonuclease/phosphatase family metal-dependent hydrolase
VVGLQEVEGHGLRYFGNQAYQLGQDCEYAAHFSPTRRHFFFPHRGNALLTRLPVTHWQREPLSPTTGKAYRNMTAYTISFNGEVVYVINTHLSKPEEQIAPLRRVLEVFSSLERVVLLGDFNAYPARPELQELLASGIEDATFIASQDPLRVDWILVRGLKVLWARSEPTGPSDHPFYLASLSLK